MAPPGPFLGAGRQVDLELAQPGIPPCPCRARRPPGPARWQMPRCRSSSAARTLRPDGHPGGPLPGSRSRIAAVTSAPSSPRSSLPSAREPNWTCIEPARRHARPDRRSTSPPRYPPAPRGDTARRCPAVASPVGLATRRLMVPLPDPLGPSMARTGTATPPLMLPPIQADSARQVHESGK